MRPASLKWKRNDLEPFPQAAEELAEFKRHSGLKVGETKLMLVRKVSSGVCEYAPVDALVGALQEIVGLVESGEVYGPEIHRIARTALSKVRP